jgi:hypothetical protein
MQQISQILEGFEESAFAPIVPTSSTHFSFQNLVFFWNLFEFSVVEITQKSISPTF